MIKRFAMLLVLLLPLPAYGAGSIDDIRIENPYVRIIGGSMMGAVFVTVINQGDTPHVLVGAEIDIARRIQLHDIEVENGIMKMLPLPSGITIPAGGEIELRPGRLHLMMQGIDVNDKTQAELILHFEDVGMLKTMVVLD